MDRSVTDDKRIIKIFGCILAVYAALAVIFFFLAGEQLKFRESRGNIDLVTADSGSIELSDGAVVEQVFVAKVDRIESVSVQFGAYYRANSGTLRMELVRPSTGDVLLEYTTGVSGFTEGTVVEMKSEVPVENPGHEPLVIRLSADSPEGNGVTPLVFSGEPKEGYELKFNGESAGNTLCISVKGLDYIWTGSHYWTLVISVGVILAGFFAVLRFRYKAGKRSYIIGALLAVRKYKFLINQLVGRDFKTRYKRSVLGALWSVLNPLLMMVVQYYVFSTIFKSDVPNFAVYLLIGLVMFNFFSEATGLTLTSVVGNAGLITKVYMPKYIYPLTRTMSSLINFALSLIPLIVMCIATGVKFHKSAFLALFFFVCLVIFVLGLGMMLSTSMVFFRDTQFLWGVLSLMWMYATPIFYPERIIPENMRGIFKLNPMYHFVKNVRICILDGISPEPMNYFICFVIALGMLALGSLVFRKEQDKFILYL